jgi:hypothetical protein
MPRNPAKLKAAKSAGGARELSPSRPIAYILGALLGAGGAGSSPLQ